MNIEDHTLEIEHKTEHLAGCHCHRVLRFPVHFRIAFRVVNPIFNRECHFKIYINVNEEAFVTILKIPAQKRHIFHVLVDLRWVSVTDTVTASR